MTIYASKVGSWSPGGRVAYLDGFAGKGQYDDSAPGSPLLLLRQAGAMSYRRLECHFVERDLDNFTSLHRLLKAQDAQGLQWHAYQGSVDDHLDDVLVAVRGVPLFAFLDPFGLGVSWRVLRDGLLHRPADAYGRPQTEVLLNLSLSDLRRNAGHLVSSKNYLKEPHLLRVDEALGGDWWRELYLRVWHQSGEDQDAAVDAVVQAFQVRIEELGWHSLLAPVRNSPNSKPVYLLLFMTRNLQGIWYFADRLASANRSWRLAYERSELRVALDAGEGGDTLFDDIPGFTEQTDLDLVRRFDEAEKLRRRGWQDVIAQNLARLLRNVPMLALRDNVESVYGTTLGLADETDVRKAVKAVHAAGYTGNDGKGDVRSLVLDSRVFER